MPTSAFNKPAGLLPLQALANLGVEYPRPNPHIIATHTPHCAGNNSYTLSMASGVGPGTNVAVAMPFVIAHPFLVRKVFWMNGSTATTDSADVGVYDESFNLKVSGGGTGITGASATQEVDVTDTLLQPGRYYLAYAQNGTTATPFGASPSLAHLRTFGAAQMSSAYPLPSTFTPAAVTSLNIRLILCGIASRTLAS